jgi:hypothetical protein
MTSYPTAVLSSVENFERRFKGKSTPIPSRPDVSQDLSRFGGSYEDYLQSAYWKAVRNKVMIRDRSTCTICGSKEQVIVHHLHYKTVRNELGDLSCVTTLCADCHADKHPHLLDDRVKSIGSKHRVIALLKQLSDFCPDDVSVEKMEVIQGREKIGFQYNVTIQGRVFRNLSLLSSFSVDSLWPPVQKLLASRRWPGNIDIKLRVSAHGKKLVYSTDDKHMGHSMTEVALSWLNGKLLAYQNEVQEIKRIGDEIYAKKKQAHAQQREERDKWEKQKKSILRFSSELRSQEWRCAIQQFLRDEPKTNTQLRNLWQEFKGYDERRSDQAYRERFTVYMQHGVTDGLWRRVKSGTYCSLNYMGS